jgi:dihydroneopterin aldolase
MNSLLVKNITIFGRCGITNGERSTGALFEIDAEVFWHGNIGDDRLEPRHFDHANSN